MIQQKLNSNREESRKTHPENKNGISLASVKTAGTYQKRGDRRRGYTSKIGLIFIIDAITGHMLDYRVLHKYCFKCAQDRSDSEFETWYEEHYLNGECDANFSGSSTEMGRHAVKEMFADAPSFNMYYQFLVGDEDSKSFLDIWDIYEICSHCEKSGT